MLCCGWDGRGVLRVSGMFRGCSRGGVIWRILGRLWRMGEGGGFGDWGEGGGRKVSGMVFDE